MATSVTPDRRPIGAELERVRLEHRARRIERALAVLRDHRAYPPDRDRPAALDQAIAGFRQELAAVRDRLRQLPGR
jgi:hypothetical protein